MRTGNVINLSVDNNLLYVIQKVSGHPTEEILPNLWEALNTVMLDALKHSKANRIKRDVQVFYAKDDRLPVAIKLYGSVRYGLATGPDHLPMEFHASIAFPKKMRNIDINLVSKAYENRLEKAIGLTDDLDKLAAFGKPDLKLSKRLKKVL